LITQLSAFSKADPSKGFGYAGAVAAEASQVLGREQQALRDKQENAGLEFQKALEKEQDAKRRGDASAIEAAVEAQKKAGMEYAKFEQQQTKIELDQQQIAAYIYGTQEQAASRKEATAARLAGQPDPEDKKLLKVQTTVNANPAVRAISAAIKDGTIEQGTPEYYDALKRINEIAKPLYVQAGLPPPEDIVGSVPNTPPVKKPGFFENLFGSSKPANKTVSFDDLPK
jgi:hypothetical protein